MELPNRVPGLAACSRDGVDEFMRGADQPHPLAAASGDGLDQQRESDARRLRQPLLLVVAVQSGVGQHRDPGLAGDLLGPVLEPHVAHRLRRRPDEQHPGLGARLGELGVLGQEPVARMQGVRAAAPSCVEDLLAVQVGLALVVPPMATAAVGVQDVRRAGVGFGVDGDRADAHGAGRTDDPSSDLAAVGHQECADPGHGRPHIRNGAKLSAPATGAECVADRARPSTVRVWRGSITPSSHSRPVA